ncbi:hypothetical protein ACGRL8_09120 [Vibrio rumoiensis]|uniref:hypothetical protein n=1 Tax=Vibrio rumoiensis TaxID=76258 RepID=UPI00374A654C
MKKLLIVATALLSTTAQAQTIAQPTNQALTCAALAYNISMSYRGINTHMENTYFAVTDKLLSVATYEVELEQAKVAIANRAAKIYESNLPVSELVRGFNESTNLPLGMTCRDFYNSFSNDKL